MKKIDLHIHTKSSFLDADFDFSQEKLNEYVEIAELDCIAITNHNLFDKAQFEGIREQLEITVLAGIEVNLEKGQILVICDGSELHSFDEACAKVSEKCKSSGDWITVSELRSFFGDLGRYLLIPHYDKKPPISDETIAQLDAAVSAGEVSSPKKFVYCAKNADKLVPVYFSDSRMKASLANLPVRQTYIDCDQISFKAIKECFRDKNKVALSSKDGNNLFQALENGLLISTGLNVVLGDRSSGKSYTLEKIKAQFPKAYHIRQFELVARDEAEDEVKFNTYLSQKQGLFSKEYLSSLQAVIEDVVDIDLESDDREVEDYVATLLAFARETEKHDAFSKAKIYSEDVFSERDQKGLKTLINSTKNLVSNVEFADIIGKHVQRATLIALFVELIRTYEAGEQVRLKKRWVNDLDVTP